MYKDERADTQEAQSVCHIAQYDLKQLEEIDQYKVADAVWLEFFARYEIWQRFL